MPLDKLLPNTETGSTARTKINECIEEVNTNVQILDYINKELPRLASKDEVMSLVINTYKGTSAPDPALGKNGDKYYQYPAEADDVLFDGVSKEKYDPLYFYILEEADHSLPIYEINVDPYFKEIEFMHNGHISEYTDIVLEISGSQYPLEVKHDSAGITTCKYPDTASPAISSIAVGTPIKFHSKKVSGKYQEYTKNNGVWVPYQVFSRETVVYDMSNVPRREEMRTAFELIPYHHYAKPLDFYVASTDNQRMTLVKYRPNGDTDSTGTNYMFYATDLMTSKRESLGGFKAPRVALRLTGHWEQNYDNTTWKPFTFATGNKQAITQLRRFQAPVNGEIIIPEDGGYTVKIAIQAQMPDNHGIEIVPMIDGTPYSDNPIVCWISDTWFTNIKGVGTSFWESNMNLTKDSVLTFAVKSYYNSNTNGVIFQRIMFSVTQD